MGERYRKCIRCGGSGVILIWEEKKECGYCLGSGFDGSALAYEQMMSDRDWEREKPEPYYPPKGEK